MLFKPDCRMQPADRERRAEQTAKQETVAGEAPNLDPAEVDQTGAGS